MINKIFNPPHYTVEDWELNYHLENILNYISRAGRKEDEIEDVKKAQWYLNRHIKKLEGRG